MDLVILLQVVSLGFIGFIVYHSLLLAMAPWSSDFLEIFYEGLAFSLPFPKTHKAALEAIKYYLKQTLNEDYPREYHLQLSVPSLTRAEEEVVVTPLVYHLLVHRNTSVNIRIIRLVASGRKECATQTERPLSHREIFSASQTKAHSSSSQLVARISTGSQTDMIQSQFLSGHPSIAPASLETAGELPYDHLRKQQVAATTIEENTDHHELSPSSTPSQTIYEPESSYEELPRHLDTPEDTFIYVRTTTDTPTVIRIWAKSTDSIRYLRSRVLDLCRALEDLALRSGDDFYLSYQDRRLNDDDASLGHYKIGRGDSVQLIRYPPSVLKEERRLQVEGSASRKAMVDNLVRARSIPTWGLKDDESTCF